MQGHLGLPAKHWRMRAEEARALAERQHSDYERSWLAVSENYEQLARQAESRERVTEVHAVYLASRDPRVPWYVKVMAVLIAGYALSPIDLIPDFIPFLGSLDDLILVSMGILLVARLIPPGVLAEYREVAAAALERPVSRIAALVVACIWVGSIGVCGWLVYPYFSA